MACHSGYTANRGRKYQSAKKREILKFQSSARGEKTYFLGLCVISYFINAFCIAITNVKYHQNSIKLFQL